MKHQERIPRYEYDSDGRAIVLVPLANHPHPAKLLREDFEALLARGISDQWTFGDNGRGVGYVRCAVDGLQTVARLIVGAVPRKVVRYRDRDTLNLRRDNLLQRRGKATRTVTPSTSPAETGLRKEVERDEQFQQTVSVSA